MTAADFYAEGQKLLSDGEYFEAEALLLRATKEDTRLLKTNRKDDFDRDLAQRFADPSVAPTSWVAYRIGHHAFHARKHLHAAGWFRSALRLIDDEYGSSPLWKTCANWLLLSNFEASTKSSIEENRRLVREWEPKHSDAPWLDLARGALAFLDADYPGATRWITRARLNEAGNGFTLPDVQRPMDSVLPWDEADPALVLPHDPEFRWEVDAKFSAPPGLPVHLCAADAGYFCKFAEALTSTAAAAGFPGLIHFHIINPDDHTAATAAHIASRFPGLAVNYSFSQFDSQAHRRAHFATARFIAARHVMELYRSDLIISDIDVALSGDIVKFAALVSGQDIGVRIRPARNYFPWKRVIVNLVYVKRSAKTVDILRYVGGYYAKVAGDPARGDIWGVDQSAFLYALEKCGAGLAVQNLNDLGYSYVSFAGNNKMAWATKVTAAQKLS